MDFQDEIHEFLWKPGGGAKREMVEFSKTSKTLFLDALNVCGGF